MDRGTLIGLLLGLALLGVAIGVGPSPRVFFHYPSLIVVFGGVIASTLIRFPWATVRSSFAVASRAFFTHPATSQAVVLQLVGLSQRARREGIKSLEKHMPSDAFLASGIQMVIDRVDRDHIREVLNAEIQSTMDRHSLGHDTFRFMGTAAPSFGMVGTLIGMVQLFTSMTNPSELGKSMALSLLSTLWGAVIAYLFAIPISGKLEQRSREEIQVRHLMMEGVLGIASEMNPGQLEEQLNAFLAPNLKIRRSGRLS